MLDGEKRVVGVGVDLPLVLEELDAKDVGQVDDGRVLAGQSAETQGVGVGDVRGDCTGGQIQSESGREGGWMLTILDDLDATRGVARVLDNVGIGALLLEDGVGCGSRKQQGRGEGGDGETHRGRDRQSTDVRGDSGDKVRAEGRATKQRQSLDAPRGGGGLRCAGYMERDGEGRPEPMQNQG